MGARINGQATVFEKKTKTILVEELKAANIAFSSLNSVEDLSNHELLRSKEIYFGESVISIADLPICSLPV